MWKSVWCKHISVTLIKRTDSRTLYCMLYWYNIPYVKRKLSVLTAILTSNLFMQHYYLYKHKLKSERSQTELIMKLTLTLLQIWRMYCVKEFVFTLRPINSLFWETVKCSVNRVLLSCKVNNKYVQKFL